MPPRKSLLLPIVALAGFAGPVSAAPAWVEQGPGAEIAGQVESLAPPTSCLDGSSLPCSDPVVGAINAIVADPSNADIVYVGTVNGGVWKTINATAAVPTWTALTDQQLPALSISSLAMSPADPTHQTLFAGTGSTSALSFFGNPGFGIARTTDGGATWTLDTDSGIFAGTAVASVVPTKSPDPTTGKNVVLAAALFGGGGVWRSADNGTTYQNISGTGGLPAGGVSQLVSDPKDRDRVYAGVPANFGAGAAGAGVYRSDDGGLTWSGPGGSNGLAGVSTSRRILLSVHNDGTTNVVYAAVIVPVFDKSTPPNVIGDNLGGVFMSTDMGNSWTALGVPSPPIYGEANPQGIMNGAIAADPSNPYSFFISGDSQGQPFPNANGCNTYSANTFRGIVTPSPLSVQWENAVCSGANGTSPHADSRDMAFNANGDLLQANDGGIYRLANPDNASIRQWSSVIGGLDADGSPASGAVAVTQLHSIAYDPVFHVVVGGAQDTGTPMQTAPGSQVWQDHTGGDGGVVAVDADQRAHPGTTLRYEDADGIQNLLRLTFDSAGHSSGVVAVGLNVVGPSSSPCLSLTLGKCNNVQTTTQFNNPFVLNAINPNRMLIGTGTGTNPKTGTPTKAFLYESSDGGNTLTDLLPTGLAAAVGVGGTYGRPIAYGGRRNGAAFPDVFYVGAGTTIYHRVSRGSGITTISAPAGNVVTIAMNPRNYKQIFISDDQNRIWMSSNEGVSWTELTGNISAFTGAIDTIEVVSLDQTIRRTTVIAGGYGVFQLRRPGAPGSTWTPLSTGFPNALVLDLHYDYADDILLAGTLGRGAWTLSGFFRQAQYPLPEVSLRAPLPAVSPAAPVAVMRRHRTRRLAHAAPPPVAAPMPDTATR